MKISRSCIICKKVFDTYPCEIKRNRGRLCSRLCANRALARNPEICKGRSERMMGQKFSKGVKHSEETKRKLSVAHKGINNWMKGKKLPKEWVENIRKASLGRTHTYETRKKLSEWQKGEKSKFWKGGITKENLRIRNSIEYKIWRKAVFERDKWTCVWCNQKGGILNADHIKPFALYPELRFAIDNGRTLCLSCHKRTDTYALKVK